MALLQSLEQQLKVYKNDKFTMKILEETINFFREYSKKAKSPNDLWFNIYDWR